MRHFILAVDFDGTIVTPKEGYPAFGPAYDHALQVLRKFSDNPNIDLVLFTCREGEPLVMAIRFLTEAGIILNAINEPLPQHQHGFGDPSGVNRQRKPFWDMLVDDRNYGMDRRAPDWLAVEKEVDRQLETSLYSHRDAIYEGVDFQNDD